MGESVSMVSRRSATWMSNDEIAQARRLAEHALSRARATADQRQKLLWLEIADTWAARAAALQDRDQLGEAAKAPPTGAKPPHRRRQR